MTDDRGNRKIVCLNVGNRLAVHVQTVINRDQYAKRVYSFYEISTGPNEYFRVILGAQSRVSNKPDAKQMFTLDIQTMLDMRMDAEMYVEQRTLKALRELFEEVEKAT